jgi:TRAP-type C4-dicarboxylate transport system permease small subunit
MMRGCKPLIYEAAVQILILQQISVVLILVLVFVSYSLVGGNRISINMRVLEEDAQVFYRAVQKILTHQCSWFLFCCLIIFVGRNKIRMHHIRRGYCTGNLPRSSTNSHTAGSAVVFGRNII